MWIRTSRRSLRMRDVFILWCNVVLVCKPEIYYVSSPLNSILNQRRILSPNVVWNKVNRSLYFYPYDTLTPFIEHAQAVEYGIFGMSPFSATHPRRVGRLIEEQANYPIYNGRPDTFHGPPMSVYHPVFGRFKDAIASEVVDPADLPLKETFQLFAAASEIYRDESSRLEALAPILERLFGDEDITEVNYRNGSQRSIRSILQGHVEVAVFVFTAELGGEDSDPSFVAASESAVRKAWVQRHVCLLFVFSLWRRLRLFHSWRHSEAQPASRR